MKMTGVEMPKPQRKNTAIAEPSAEMEMTVVGWRWSVREPSRTVPRIAEKFRRETRRVEGREERLR